MHHVAGVNGLAPHLAVPAQDLLAAGVVHIAARLVAVDVLPVDLKVVQVPRLLEVANVDDDVVPIRHDLRHVGLDHHLAVEVDLEIDDSMIDDVVWLAMNSEGSRVYRDLGVGYGDVVRVTSGDQL